MYNSEDPFRVLMSHPRFQEIEKKQFIIIQEKVVQFQVQLRVDEETLGGAFQMGRRENNVVWTGLKQIHTQRFPNVGWLRQLEQGLPLTYNAVAVY